MGRDIDDAITSIARSAEREIHKTIDRQDELDAKTQFSSGDLLDVLRYWEASKIRPFIAKAFTIVFVALVVGSIIAAISSVFLPINGGDVLIDRVLKVNQSIIPVVTLVIGFYFGASHD